MNDKGKTAGAVSRRGILRGVAVGGGAVAAAALLPAGAAHADDRGPAGGGTVRQVPGVHTVIDTSHATDEAARIFSAYFRTKSAKDYEGISTFFSKQNANYLDAILGWPFYGWQAIHDLFAQYMPRWPKDGTSSPVRILGDATSAVVFFTNTTGLFGPSEMRAAGVVNFQRGKIARWVDYWDGRHFGTDNLDAERLPADQFPTDWMESTVGETASPVIRKVSEQLSAALQAGEGERAAALFASDAVFEDMTAHLQILGPRSIGAYLTTASDVLPYTGKGTRVRHVVGSARGGGYEWAAAGPVPRGLHTLELDAQGRITRLTAVWDGTLVDDETLMTMARRAIEH
ncbi:sigma-70 family RNA polymerase sigma factor family protein [Streptomyces nodosus]|uniref:hypothetical protein n=1 Tax=Streptomyces nodosus TaxID=40318 RepID=UPI0006939013|nr:hypothetical protein [Streptomyces nodosus]